MMTEMKAKLPGRPLQRIEFGAAMKRLTFLIVFAFCSHAQSGWWMKEPLRWLQTNLREPDSGTDPLALAREAARFKANVLHINMGGITATYPTQVPFHTRSPFLREGSDFFGEALNEAHRLGLRVVARFDFSKARRAAFEAHPEWFFVKADGQPVIYNGLYSTCINSAWYREHAIRILTEALEKYPVDGVFFNMFGNQSSDYSGNFVGHCHCRTCKRLFRERYGRDLPARPDNDYRDFMFRSSREVAALFGRLIHAKRPNAGYFNYIHEHTDGIMSESNTAMGRPLPLWPYTSSDNVNRARNSEPGKMSVNLCMQFVDYAWRFATVPDGEIRLRLWQNMAHGGALAFAINGTFAQQDRQAVEAARPVFEWAALNEQYLQGQQSMAKVMLLARGDASNYRGLFRLLTEEHIPFAVSTNLDWIGKRQVDLVVAPAADEAGLAPYAAAGGRVLYVGAKPGSPEVKGYVRVRDRARFPSLVLADLLMLNGPFTMLEDDSKAALTMIPPSMFGPPEFIHTDMKETQTPALVSRDGGRSLWLPFELGSMYHRLSLPAHAGLMRDLLKELLPQRQLTTNAHPLVEVSLMKQGERTLVHLINLSGHSQTGYFEPLKTGRIRIDVEGEFQSARALKSKAALTVAWENGRTMVSLPSLEDYELIALGR
jgi:hypothetical protein